MTCLQICVERLEVPRQQHRGQLEDLVGHLRQKHVRIEASRGAVAQRARDLQPERAAVLGGAVVVQHGVAQRLPFELGGNLLEAYLEVDGQVEALQVFVQAVVLEEEAVVVVGHQEAEKVEGVRESAPELVGVARRRRVRKVRADLGVDLVPEASGHKTEAFYVSVAMKRNTRTCTKLRVPNILTTG